MTDTEIQIECARLDGAMPGQWLLYASTGTEAVVTGRVWSELGWTYADGSLHENPPDYLNSYDAIIPAIQRRPMPIKQFIYSHIGSVAFITFQVTPRELAIAWLKAEGVWRE